MRETYCTKCKMNVKIDDSKYLKLANNRLAIEGCCSICKTKLLKVNVMPRSGKKPMKRKKRYVGMSRIKRSLTDL
ncbi:MAG: DUF5679 domain-containing protein [Candidatus Nitrosopolaris sp.]